MKEGKKMDKQVKMEEYAGYQYVEGGICAAQGFTANGLNCGLNPDKAKNDLGMVYSERLCTAAAVYITNKVKGALPDRHTAVSIAKSVVQSSLVKCLLFGGDANWGRIMCAIRYTEADFDIDKVDVDVASAAGTIEVCRGNAVILPFSEEKAAEVLAEDEIHININLHQGEGQAKAWGCDLTYDYVKINGDYRS